MSARGCSSRFEIPCGADFAKSKTLAKIANHIGKKRPTKVFVMPDDSTLDAINAKYGRGTIFHLSEGIKKPWQMRRDMLTPNYTTSWSQIPVVK